MDRYWLAGAFGLWTLLMAPGAEATEPQLYTIFEPTLSCEQAKQLATRSAERIGYKVTAPAAGEKPGVFVIKGTREGPAGQAPVTVTITCGADGVHVDAKADIPPCEQANRLARASVERAGFTVTTFSPATMKKRGVIHGKRDGEKGAETVSASIICDENAIYLDTASDSPLLNSKEFLTPISDFRRGFYSLFKPMADALSREQRQGGKKEDQISVVIKPLQGSLAKEELGVEVPGILPVRVEINNRTKRAYLLETNKIVLLATLGNRVQPVSQPGKDLVKLLANQSIAPGATVSGYLYYPAGYYTGARGFLVEAQSEEREGFDIQF